MIGLYLLGGAMMGIGGLLFLFGKGFAIIVGLGCLMLGVMCFVGAQLIGGQRAHYRRSGRRGYYDDYDEPRRLSRGRKKKRIIYEEDESSDEYETEVEVRDAPRKLPVIKRKPIHMRKR